MRDTGMGMRFSLILKKKKNRMGRDRDRDKIHSHSIIYGDYGMDISCPIKLNGTCWASIHLGESHVSWYAVTFNDIF